MGFDAALTGKTLCVGLLFGFVLHADGLLRRVRVGKRRHPTARRLRQAKDQPRQRESGQRKQDERRTPRQRRDVAGDGEADTRACELSRKDVSINAAALGPSKVIAHEGSDHGPAAAVTAPRATRVTSRAPKLETVALQIIAMPQREIAAPSIQVRRPDRQERRTAGL